MVERCFLSLREECVWQHNFGDFAEAELRLPSGLTGTTPSGSYQAPGYRSPREFRGLQPKTVA